MDKAQPLKLRPEDEARAKARAAQRSSGPKLTDEHLLIAEFGLMYGWEAVRDVLSDELSADDFLWLLEAGRRVKLRRDYALTSNAFTAAVSAQAKNPGQAFKTNTAAILKAAKADV